jgi:hypothetical protein
VTFGDGMMALLEPIQLRHLAVESKLLKAAPSEEVASKSANN